MQKITLYHGTDARMIDMTELERLHFFDQCDLVINTLFPYFEPLIQIEQNDDSFQAFNALIENRCILKLKYEKILDEKGGPNTFLNLFEKLKMVEARNDNNGLYQYQMLYVTNFKPIAMHFARRSYAGCELGLIAYQMARGAQIIEFEDFLPDKKTNEAIDYILEFGKEGNERPIIITIENYDVNALTDENGGPMIKGLNDLRSDYLIHCNHSYRYNKPIDLKKCKIEKLTEDLCMNIKKEWHFSLLSIQI